MNASLLLANLTRNLAALGARRLAALAAGFIALAAAILGSAHYASRPEFVTLYANLDRQDVTAMGDALAREGIAIDITADGATLLVPPGNVTRARTLLAEKGLPRSTNSGYELFDTMGSLGLTSFMQEVTLVRALEGEIARTIQTMRGISAARVHLVLPDQAGLSRDRQAPTAAVIIRTDGITPAETARTIRHLVAAAVPKLTVDAVTVSDTDGNLLAGEGEAAPNATALFGLERTIAATIEQNLRRALLPVMGVDNFRISVSARLNSDRREINETVYDPDGRVERSQRVTRSAESSTNSDSDAPVTVTEEMAEDEVGATTAATNSEEAERREEQTDYAVSSRTTATVSDGYDIRSLSIAIVLNRASLGGGDVAGEDSAAGAGAATGTEAGGTNEAQVQARVEALRGLLSAASGLDPERGDVLTLTALDFAGDAIAAPQPEGFDAMAFLSANAGTLIRTAGFLAVVFIALQFGLRPALRAVAAPAELSAAPEPARLAAPDAGAGEDDPAADVAAKMQSNARRRLERIVALDEDKAVAVLKQWLNAA
jgi:flagellar M-ring protein FliF